MEIFIVEVNSVRRGDETGYDTKAYSTEEKAKSALKELVDDNRDLCKKDGWIISSDDDDYFLACNEDDYLYNHLEIAVRCLEVI